MPVQTVILMSKREREWTRDIGATEAGESSCTSVLSSNESGGIRQEAGVKERAESAGGRNTSERGCRRKTSAEARNFVPAGMHETPRGTGRNPGSIMHVVIVMAAYREARALDILLPGIFARLAEAGISGGVLVVNDLGAHDEEMSCCCRRHGAQMIDAPHNLGSQEAIMHGLRQLPEGDLPDLVITMDSDGQDDISALPLLIRESLKNPDSIVVAQRVGNRPEGVRFSIGYEIYKLGFWLLTGIRPDFGNYAAYGGRTAGRIARNPMLGPAYSMALPLVAPLIRLPVCRLPRLHGQARVGWSGPL